MGRVLGRTADHLAAHDPRGPLARHPGAGGVKTVRIALVGDHDPGVTAHRAIPGALELAGLSLGLPLAWSGSGPTCCPRDPPRHWPRRTASGWFPTVPTGARPERLPQSGTPGKPVGRSSAPAPGSSTRYWNSRGMWRG